MSQIKSKNTKPELILKNFLEKKSFIYQQNKYSKLDFIDYKKRIVIFIDGCFWHKCPKCFQYPEINKNFLHDKEINLNYRNSG